MGKGVPIVRAAILLKTVPTERPWAETSALIMVDAVLAQVLGWDHVMPLLAADLKRADLRQRGEDLGRACHRSVTASAIQAMCLAATSIGERQD